jgi:hypothetical protein
MKTATSLAGSRLATTGVRADDRGDHIRERVDLRLKCSDRLVANGHMDRQGDRVENRLDQRGNRIDRHVDRRLSDDH